MFTVYKVTNTTNGKYYIGVHKTKTPNDAYMGSGLAIKAAIAKYGKDCFTKEVLLCTENKEEAYLKERELTSNFADVNNYNMRLGGVGGFTRENARKGLVARSRKGGEACRDRKVGIHSYTSEQLAANARKAGKKRKGQPKSEAHKEALRQSYIRRTQQAPLA